MKTLKNLGLIFGIVAMIAIMGASSKWLWSNRESAILPTVAEINAVDSIKTDQPIQRQLDAKFNIADAQLGYTADQVDALIFNQELGNIIRKTTGVDYRLPILANTLALTGVALIDGRRYWVKFVLEESDTIANVTYALTGTQGDYTQSTVGEKNHMKLYSYNAGVITAIDSTENDRDMWKATPNTFTSKAWKGGSHVLVAGTYYLGFIWTATTNVQSPTINVVATLNAGSCGTIFGTTGFPVLFQNTQTSLPDSFDFSTLSSVNYSTSVHMVMLKP